MLQSPRRLVHSGHPRVLAIAVKRKNNITRSADGITWSIYVKVQSNKQIRADVDIFAVVRRCFCPKRDRD